MGRTGFKIISHSSDRLQLHAKKKLKSRSQKFRIHPDGALDPS